MAQETKKETNRYYVMYGVGKVKYIVNYHTVGNYHRDGSDFFDVYTTNNKRKLEKFTKDLESKGYVYRMAGSN